MRTDVDKALADLPPGLLPARRLIAREMQFEPRPEELQTIVKIAGFVSTSIVGYELPRQMLALRVLAERALRYHWDSRRLSADRLGHTAALIEDLLVARQQFQVDLTIDPDAMSQLADDERDFLLHVDDVILPPKERLEATSVLAPRLELLARQATGGELGKTFPGLNDDEIEMFDQAVHLDDDSPEGPSRICLDAVALRTVYEECQSLWENSAEIDDTDFIEQLRDRIRSQLRKTESAYRVVSQQLQAQQDTAISASLDEFAEEVRGVKSKLFEVYLKTRPLMKDVDSRPARRSLADTLAEAADADERVSSKEKLSEELFLDALTGLRQDDADAEPDMHPLAVAKRAYRRRLWRMAATSLVLALIALAVQLFAVERIPDPVDVALKEFQPSLSVIDAMPIGAMLYVKVSDWENLTVEETRIRTDEIGMLASSKGLTLAYVVSDSGRALAEWHPNGGVLVKPKPPEPEEVISQSKSTREPITITDN